MDITKPGAQSITLVRTFAAPIAEVFAAWTDPALMWQWLAPSRCKVLEVSADPRPGGSYRIVVLPPFGSNGSSPPVNIGRLYRTSAW